MANITGKKTIFFVTSPRTPDKMIDEIDLLVRNLSGKKWDKKTQQAFANLLRESEFFQGKLAENDDFGARDRINRSPKALGFVDLNPISLTPAGEQYVYGKRPSEALTRQLLKFQLPSPFHVDKGDTFYVKPYLELMRMVYELNGLSKDEIQAFFMEMVSYDLFDEIKNRILKFRKDVRSRGKQISYKTLLDQAMNNRVLEIYDNEIKANKLKTRESKDTSLTKFLRTKKQNYRDYADAAIRYLRATELFELEPRTYRLVVAKGKKKDVEYILNTVDRKPYPYKDENDYKEYLYNPNLPKLLTDNKDELISKIIILDQSKKHTKQSLSLKDIGELKDIHSDLVQTIKAQNIEAIKNELASYSIFEDVQQVFEDIKHNNVVDAPLYFEWNTWRAITMITSGNIIGNFRVDTEGNPLQTAPGNKPDIYCDYTDFDVIVEVTLSTGHKQYEMEGEPITRHLAAQKRLNQEKGLKKESYCLFIAQKVSEATLAYIYSMHRINISYYGGTSKIIPIDLSDFQLLLNKLRNRDRKANVESLKIILEEACKKALTTENELQWQKEIKSLFTT